MSEAGGEIARRGVCCGGECPGCPVGDANLAGLVEDMQNDCSHEWLDHPESDIRDCLLCGLDGNGSPPAQPTHPGTTP